jgi:peroxiredoxin
MCLPLRVLLPALLLLGAWQCSTQTTPVLEGNIRITEGWKPVVYLVQPRQFAEVASSFSGLVLDSAQIGADGNFRFPKMPSGPVTLQLCVQKHGNKFPNQLLDDSPLFANYMPLVWTGKGHLRVNAQAAAFQATYAMPQSDPENLALLRLRDLRHQAWQQEAAMLEGAHDENSLMAYEEAIKRFQAPLMQFADTCTQWPSALVAARWVSTQNDYERIPEFVVRQCQRWQGHPEAATWFQFFCDKRQSLPVITGDLIPDYALPMADGDTLMLHQLLGSKITVLDIWASWCAPCRKENREVLQPLWATRPDGLQIIGYSIDASSSAWKAAIAKDGATWPHASHLSGDETPFTTALRISTIPANFILDKEGKVIAKNLHGTALSDFIREYLRH